MSNRTRTITLMLPLMMSACMQATSVNGMQKREPVLVADSPRDGTAIITCVSAAWLKLGGATPKSVPRETGAMLVLGDNFPLLMVQTTPTPTGTHLVMHQFKTVWSDNDRHRVEEVRACL
ncbi:hypothetical protein [Sphingomonas kyungheensis]|uniref:Lipoprotein n=1 Tax=Sphingomonas kyungheensis TaxID=1069987 RepID=A0ABU8H6P7_9SPHN